MKAFFLFLPIFLTTNLFSQKKEIYQIVQEMPYFGECKATTEDCFKYNFFNFIRENIKYPSNYPVLDIKVRAYMKFIVDAKGKVKNITIERSSGIEEFDKKAIQVLKKLPKFNPGVQNGKKVNVQYLVPIDFLPNT